MEPSIILAIIAVAIPATSTILIWSGDVGISERHHRHHDTYVIASTLTWSLVFAMIIMGSLGVLMGWLCMVGVFHVDAATVLGFFDAFLIVSFVYWVLLRRYKVVTYEDRLDVTPFVGRKTTIPYEDISLMEWTPSLLLRNSRSVGVFVGHRRRALLWGGLDLDQILIRIDRFDALENLGA